MLLLRKNFFFFNIFNKFNNIIILYYRFKNKLFLILNTLYCLLHRYKIISKTLKYIYNLKWVSLVSYILKIKFSFLKNFLFYLNNLTTFKYISILSNSKYIFSVIRSPFVYKKSMEQFFYNTYKISCQNSLANYNYFLQNYIIK